MLWRPSTGCWYEALAANNFTYDNVCIQWGVADDIPVTGDFDGDGRADLAVSPSFASLQDSSAALWVGDSSPTARP